MKPSIVDSELENYMTKTRRYFHQHPELSTKEIETANRIENELKSMGLNPVRVGNTNLYADIKGMYPGKMVAVRADIDALPVTEENKVEYVSQNKGVMHACGHDSHITMVLGVGKLLTKYRDFKGTVRLLFQSAEELPPGGAKELINGGALKNVDFVIGQHVESRIPSGYAAVFYHEAMANADEFRVKIHGVGGHGSAPQEAVDALIAAAEFVNLAQTIISRKVDPYMPAVVTVGTFNSGYRYNIIAAHAELTGTVRTFHKSVQEQIKKELEHILKGVCDATHTRYEFEYIEGYPALINNEKVARVIEAVAQDVLGKDKVLHPNPSMGGEDFSYYLQEKPGSFYFLGVGNEKKGITSPQHSPTYDIDEDAMKYGTEILYRTAVDLLSK
ncbi:amidohydrolase [Oxyplasma meridianum]|uniref:Amidohydrolase n=1 Tax=Oxyplasma meridianum TaxID=3073602 RepID=A0AAX4NF38_9ARCH